MRLPKAIVSIIFLASLGLCNSQANAEIPRTVIEHAYKDQDLAWLHHVASEEIAWYVSQIDVVDQEGHSHVLDRTRQLEGARFDVRTTPGTTYFPRQTTAIKTFALNGKIAIVKRLTIKELATIDRNGTSVYARFTMQYEDEWNLTNEGWREVRTRLLTIDKFSDGRPSPAILAAIGQMRATTNMMNEFNSAINFSNCMSSDGNQRYDVQTRRQYCSQ